MVKVIDIQGNDDSFNVNVGSRIKSRRIELGLRQTDIVSACGISPSHYSDCENGKRGIGFRRMCVLAKTLNKPVGWFAEGASL